MSQASIKITFTLALLTGLLMGFQNCTLSKFTSGGDGATTASSVGPTTTGGFDGNNGNGAPGGDDVNATGGGFDGKAMVHVGQCLGQVALDTIVLVNAKGTAANFIRSKCVDQSLPFANRISELDMSGFNLGIIRVVADGTLLSVDTNLMPGLDGTYTLPKTWTVPASAHRMEILCITAPGGHAGVSFSIYSYDGSLDNAFADIQYPTGMGPLPTAADITSGIVSGPLGDIFTGVPFKGNHSGGTGSAYTYNFSSNDQMFSYSATANGYYLTANDPTGAYASANLLCYSELPGMWSVYNSGGQVPNPLAKVTADIQRDETEGDR